MVLTQGEIHQFHEQGYFIKRDILDKGLIEKCLDHYWKSAPEGFHRDDPSTWRGMISKNAFTGENIEHDGYNWKDFNLKNTHEGCQLIAENTEIREAAESLMTGIPKQAWIRGIFGVLPGAPGRGMHIDGPRSERFVGVVGLLESVGEDAGGFTFHPKSHRRVSELIASGVISVKEPRKDLYNRQKWEDALTEASVQFTGNAGDIVFWHYNLVHQYTKNESNQIRIAMFTDFKYEQL